MLLVLKKHGFEAHTPEYLHNYGFISLYPSWHTDNQPTVSVVILKFFQMSLTTAPWSATLVIVLRARRRVPCSASVVMPQQGWSVWMWRGEGSIVASMSATRRRVVGDTGAMLAAAP